MSSNKDLVVGFCDAFSRGDWARLELLCTDDFRWRARASGLRQSDTVRDAPILNDDPGWTRDETLEIFRQTKNHCRDGVFDLQPVTLTAEDDRVAVEAVGNAIRADNGSKILAASVVVGFFNSAR